MGILKSLFSKQKNNKKVNWLDVFTPYFSNDDSAEMSATFTSIVEAHARHISKIEPYVYLNGKRLDQDYITTLLKIRPNPLMNAPTFWETAARNYYTENNVFIYLDWDHHNRKKPLKALWIIDPDKNSLQIKKSESGEIFICFRLEGSVISTSIDNVACISKNVDPSHFLGSRNKAIRQVLKVLKTNYEGIEQAVRSSAFIRFIVTSATLMSDQIKKEKAKYFAETYLGKDASGVVYIDQAQDVKQVSSAPKYADAEQLNLFKKDIYEYLGATDKITMASFTEDEWQSQYESTLEPFIIKVASELMYKIYGLEGIEKGYSIQVDVDRMQTASIKTRIRASEVYMKLPVIQPNVVNKMLGLPLSDYGDEEYGNLNYVKAKEQSLYQTGNADAEDNPKEEEKNDE